ncbi:hypothetical protein HXX76_005480 [Chlamydomonas incerta]|uniref:Uncharacterized protein n=1 Tax=Chlamydomonas incerta TaxID=51695 RepID=A0A835W279_CHLIN|nr:hypothetical protein HXX76_005480 [Chlamydomonas incerta]|eukprot:KAG2437862.1 hypothetical protein HXX76_005480 [Chlamydomonas incerta]
MGTSVRYQTRALFAKSATYQRRNTATNVCLVVAPIFFCVLLAALQLLANKLLLNQRSNKCGCQCLECCIPRREQVPWTEDQQARIDAGETLKPRFRRYDDCQPLTTGYCERWRNSTCRTYNDSNCSLRFSSPQQSIFCPIPTPSSWPPVIMTPRRAFRAGGPSTQWLPFTGRNMTAATAVAANLMPAPDLPNPQALLDLLNQSPLALLSLRPEKILQLLLPVLAPGGLVLEDGEAVDLAQLSRLGLNFGSGLWPNNDYYLENAFINSNSNNSQLNFLVPSGVCNATGLYRLTTSASNQMPLASMLLSYYNATYPAVLGPVLRLLNITTDTQFMGPAAYGTTQRVVPSPVRGCSSCVH